MRFALLTLLSLPLLPAFGPPLDRDPPAAQALIDRHEREKSPVWADGDTATFFYRAEAEQVNLFLGGERLKLRRIPGSDVWTTTVRRPGLEKGVFTYSLRPGRKDQPALRRFAHPGGSVRSHQNA